MIRYLLSPDPLSHLLHVEMTVSGLTVPNIEIQLPAWRPGRYELQNFAKNIQYFSAIAYQHEVQCQKISKDRWLITTNEATELKIHLGYYCQTLNAGGSWIADDWVYLNLVNCLPYVEGRMDEAHEVFLQTHEHYTLACGLPQPQPHTLIAQNYQQLIDCPLLAGPNLRHEKYVVANTDFHLWFQGNYQPDFERIKTDFKRFTAAQISQFGEFPQANYHFLILIVPTPYYHGVEHQNSTVIVLGPDTEGENLYSDLLGVCSHELYHAWNVCQIRPKELLPYNLCQENYFTTGFIVEGVTTYLGDWFLVQSGVFSEQEYLKELTVLLKRHFERDDSAMLSLVDSSYDLWLDGYAPAIPGRRVSIYQKGALVALLLDISLRKATQHQCTIHTIMEQMWKHFGKPFVGYQLSDYEAIVRKTHPNILFVETYFEKYIKGNFPLEGILNEYLSWVNLCMIREENTGLIRLEIGETNEAREAWLRGI